MYEQRVGKHWSGSASLFYNDIQDLISLQEDPTDNFFYFANQSSVQAQGAEFEIAAQWASGLRGRASYTYTHTEDSATGQQLSNAPENLGQVQLSVPLWRDKLFASLEFEAMSERDTVRGGSVGPVWLLNATLFSQKIVKGLEFSASVYNLLGQHYSDPASSDFTQDSIQQDGRQFRLKLTYKF